jgi:hypothetical protein
MIGPLTPPSINFAQGGAKSRSTSDASVPAEIPTTYNLKDFVGATTFGIEVVHRSLFCGQ